MTDYSNLSDDELDARIADLKAKRDVYGQGAAAPQDTSVPQAPAVPQEQIPQAAGVSDQTLGTGVEPNAQPAQPAQPPDYSSLSDEELDRRIAELRAKASGARLPDVQPQADARPQLDVQPGVAPELGVFARTYQNMVASAGRDVGGMEAVGRLLPVIGSFIEADDHRVNRVVGNLVNGTYPNALAMAKAAKSIGVPDEIIERIGREAGKDLPRSIAGFPVDQDGIGTQRAREMWKQEISALYQAREAAKRGAMEKLAASPPTKTQQILGGMLMLPKTVVELTPAGLVLSGGANVVNRAASLAERGEDEDTALWKGAAGVASEALIWNKLNKLIGMIPGAKAVGQKIAKHLLSKNATQLLDMSVKSKITELVDDVAGMDRAPKEERKRFNDWANEFFSVQSHLETMLEMLPAHILIKGAGRAGQHLTAEGRASARDAKAHRQQLEQFVGKDAMRGLSDNDVANLYRILSSPHLTDKSIADFIDRIDGDMSKLNLKNAAQAARDSMSKIEVLPDVEEAKPAGDAKLAEDAQMVAAEEAKYREANERADAERQAEADGAEQLAREEAYRSTEAPQEPAGARGETVAADVPSASPDAPQGAEAASGEAVEVVDRPNRLRRQQPNNFRHPGDNRLRPAVPDINQQPIRETNDETGNGADEAPAQPVAQVSGRDGRQPPPEAGARPLEGAAARAEAPDAGVVAPQASVSERASSAVRADGAEPQTAEKLRDAMKGDNVLKKIDAAYKKAKTDAERNALKEKFAARVAELRKQLGNAAETNRLRNAAGEDPLAASGKGAAPSAEDVASRSTNGEAEDVERKFREASDMAQNLLDTLHRGRKEQLNLSLERYDGMKAAIADAKPVKVKGIENGTAGIVKVGDRWRVIDLQSGFYFGDGENKADAIAESERRIGIAKERGDLERIIQEGRDAFAAARSKNDAASSNSDVAALTAKAQALAAEYAALPDMEKVSAKGRDLEQRIAEAWDAVDAAERAENAPASAPRTEGTTTPPKAAKPAEGGKSASSATPAAPTPEMRRKATAAMRILGADAGKDADALERQLRQMEARGQAASGPGRRRADALRDLAAYKRAVGTKEVSAEEIAERRQRDAEQRIIEGGGERLPSEDFYGRRQSRGNGDMPAKWTDAAKKPLERVARALRNVVTVGGKKIKVSFADRPAGADGQTRKSIGGIFTGTAADYANESREGGKGDGPRLQKIGTGEGSQVYGWGLYGSTVRGVAETYAKNIKEEKYTEVRYKGRTLDEDAESDLIAIGSAVKYVADHPKEATGVEDYYGKMIATYEDRGELYKPYAEAARRQLEIYKADPGAWKAEKPREQVYEQTFFTDRAPGDESHLLKWYEPVEQELVNRVIDKAKEEGVIREDEYGRTDEDGKTLLWADDGTGHYYQPVTLNGGYININVKTGKDLYKLTCQFFPKTSNRPKAASEFLARAGIDGVKYPVDSYGGKGVKDGDKVGWNYVSFRDDNIRVDHKWTDGQLRYMRNGDGEVVGEYDAANGEIRLYPGATVADVVHEFTHPLVDYARAEAKAGRGELLGKIKEIIDAERATWEKPVRDAYADKGEGEILEEIFTHVMGDKGATLFGKSTTTLEGRRWYNRLWDAIKGLWQDFATKMGWNRADLRGLDSMSPEDAAQKILSEMAKGRSFGDAVTGGEGAGGTMESRRVTPRGIPPAPTNQDIQDYLGGKDGFMRRLRRAFQDKNIVIRDVEERLGVTDKDASTYYAKDRAFGKNEHELTVLQKQEVEPIVEKIHKSGGSLELFSAYLYARHSGERNAALKASKGVENGSGMTKEQADTIFNDVDRLGLRAAFEDAAKDVWAMNRKYLKRRVDSGRMTHADYDFYTQRYKHYVPLRTDMTDEELDIFNSTTGGWKRNELMAAQGRRSAADDPFAFSIVQNEQAIRASNANEVRRRFAGLVRRSKGALGEVVDGVNKGGAKWSFTFGDGETVETGSPMRLASERDDIVLFKENGQLKAVKVKPGEHGRGLDIARAVTDKDVTQFNRHLEWIPRATRWMSAMRTQYVPTFIVRNMKADNLEVMLNALSERGVKDGAKFFGKFLKNEVSVAKGVKEYFKTGKSSDRFVQEAVENGLLTGGGMSAEGFTETARRLSDTLQALRERPKILGGAFEAAKDTISLLNACAEYNTRMGVYKTLREEGMSVADAVSYARDVTVNFNRKGYLTPYTNAAFMFSNAAIQGMGRAFKSMNSAHGKEVLAGMFLVGVAQALLDDWLGHDDESEKSGGADSRNLTEYDKSHSLGVALPTGHRVKTGIRNPWALPMYAGRKAVELLKGITSGEQAMKDLASEVGQFVTEPVGGNGFDSTSEFLQTLAPTIIDPFVQWGTGKDYRGQDRLKKSFDKYAPDSWNGKDSTPEAYKAVAKALNFISGGSEHRKGALDVAPENVRLLTETVFGGVLTDLNNLIKGGEHAVDAVRGKPAAQIARDIPFVRDTFTNMPDNTSRFYAALDAYNADKAEFKKTTELGRRRDMKREKPYLTQGKGRVDTLIERVKELRHLERGEVKAGQKWVERKNPISEERKRRFREQRLAVQARVLKMLGE